MSEPFLGEIRPTSFGFAPKGWALCNGQLLAINQNQALFAILGTTYGGNGTTNFALPNLQGRVPLHTGNGIVLGQQGGVENVTLTLSNVPAHSHAVNASTDFADSTVATGGLLGAKGRGGVNAFGPANDLVALEPTAVSAWPTNSAQPHNNIQPSLTLNFIIALQGIFPSQN